MLTNIIVNSRQKYTWSKLSSCPTCRTLQCPMHAARKSAKLKLQSLINRALKWVSNDIPPYSTTIKGRHIKWNIKPLTIQLFNQSKRTWAKIKDNYEEIYTELSNESEGSHSWWSSALISEEAQSPPLTSIC